MERTVIFPVSSRESISGALFDDSTLYGAVTDIPCPMLSSTHALSDPALFDAYIAGMAAKERQHHHHYPFPPTPTPTSSERSSLEDDARLDDSPSQATITQVALRTEATLKLKKKRSFGQALKAFKTSSLDFTENLMGTKRTPCPHQPEDASAANVSTEPRSRSIRSAGPRRVDEDDGFEDRNRTVRRRNMPHHPFSPEDAPYMQAYSQVLLENDYQTHQLMCKLTRADSPTFHGFGKKPPADVLDLGCGEGFWVLHAAKLWKSSNVVGLDLIDLHTNEAGEVHPHLEPEHTPKNVTWKRANFLKYPLPFPDNSFDLVRMANLTLCIPVSRWKFVLTQVRRVLRPGGRLELVDDDVFFPTILPRPSRDAPSQRQWHSAASSDTAFASTLSPMARSLSEKPLPELPSTQSSPVSKKGHARTPSDIEFSTNSGIANHLETIFQNMLANRYDIAPRPHAFLEHMLRDVFGPTCARQTQTLELAVPSREVFESCEDVGLGPGSSSRPSTASCSHTHSKRLSEDEKRGKGAPWTSLECQWERKEKRSGSPVPGHPPLPPARTRSPSRRTSDENSPVDARIPDGLAPKARQLLLGDANRTPSWKATGPYQPPGLVLLPSTLIPCSPLELEMHACKHMNTLLGCKDALSKYITAQQDRHGQPLMSEKEVDDYLWDYECFRRKRFHWPLNVAELQLENDADEPAPPSPPPKSAIFKFAQGATQPEPKRAASTDGPPAQMYGGLTVTKQSSTHVRTIRVYEALESSHHCSCHCGGH